MNSPNKPILIASYITAIALSVVSYLIQSEFGSDKSPLVIALFVSSWSGVFFIQKKCSSLVRAQRDVSFEKMDVAEQSRFLDREIVFYEQRKKDLAMRAAQRRILSDAARGLGSVLDPTEIQKKLLETALLLFPSQRVNVSFGQNQDEVDAFVVQKKQPLLLPNETIKGESMVAAPITAQRQVVGVLRVAGAPEPYNRDDLRLLESLTSLASLAMDNCVLFHQVQQSAVRDNLTGLLTNKAFQEQLETALLEASRYRQKVSVVLADIDHFKAINDSYGHQAGDAVLQGFAHVMDRNVRSVDVIARVGGEEFYLLLLQTDHSEATAVAESIRRDLMGQIFDIGSKKISITGSFGVATFPDEATSAQQLMRQADQRMYKAKANGRNNVQSRVA